jgi:GTP-binding protein
MKSVFSLDELPDDSLLDVAFVGRSNVGKSSLLNIITGKKLLAQISKKPGRTRAINFFRVDPSFYLADLPGYGYAEVAEKLKSRWRALIEGYLRLRKKGVFIVLIIDARHKPFESDITMMDWLLFHRIPHVVALTKMDKLPRGKREKALLDAARLLKKKREDIIPFSAKTGEGKKELLKVIDGFIRGYYQGMPRYLKNQKTIS